MLLAVHGTPSSAYCCLRAEAAAVSAAVGWRGIGGRAAGGVMRELLFAGRLAADHVGTSCRPALCRGSPCGAETAGGTKFRSGRWCPWVLSLREARQPRSRPFVRWLQGPIGAIARILDVEVVAVTSRSSLTQSPRTSSPPAPVTVTVTVRHPLDLAEVDVVRTALSCALGDHQLIPGATVVLEMSGCDFVDMIGYRLLREAAGTAQARGLVLQLAGVRDEVVRILGRLDQLLRGQVQQHVLGACWMSATGDGTSADRHRAAVLAARGGVTTSPMKAEGVLGDAGDDLRAST